MHWLGSVSFIALVAKFKTEISTLNIVCCLVTDYSVQIRQLEQGDHSEIISQLPEDNSLNLLHYCFKVMELKFYLNILFFLERKLGHSILLKILRLNFRSEIRHELKRVSHWLGLNFILYCFTFITIVLQ